ncbi:MAG: RNA polymerase sigma factor [Cyclobacteriaceae bacterium]|nr:RNA polymerase sigma factor [Cyclobacteriaceae bacterium]
MYLEYFKKEIIPLKQKLYRFVRAYLKNEASAEDIVQDVFLKLWDNRDEFRKIQNVEAWSMTMARNMVLDKLRRERNYSVDPHEMSMNGYNNETPEMIMERDEVRTDIRRVIERLPDKQKEVILLREIEGYSYQKIGEIMGIDQNLVKVTLFRARENLRKKILKTERYGL